MIDEPELPEQISFDPWRRDAQIRAARAIIADITGHDDATLLRACDTLLALGTDLHDRTVAQELRAVLTRDAPATAHDADAPPPAGKDGGRGHGGGQS